MPFASVLGHDRVKQLLARAMAQHKLPPTVLLSGPEGVGKKTLALEVARAAVCPEAQAEACGVCSTCRRVARAQTELPEARARADARRSEPASRNLRLHPDVVLVEPWRTRARDDIRVEQVRDLVREITAPPFESPARVFVVDDAHTLTEQAQNAFLKALEEPPKTSHVFLVSHAPQALLPTIRSRCQQLRLGALARTVLERHLARTLEIEPEEAKLRAALAAGSLSRALAFESQAYRQERDALLELLESVPALGPVEALEAAEGLKDLEDIPRVLTTLRGLLRDMASLRAGAGAETMLNGDVAARIEGLAAGPLGPPAGRLAEAVGEARGALMANANKLLAMDLLLDTFTSTAAGMDAG
jgi:DNA polymerase-3 subunit delta'